MKEIDKKFADAVRARRIELAISQEKLASMAGIHRTYMSSIERGRVQVSIAVAKELATALDVTLAKLVADAERGVKPRKQSLKDPDPKR